LGLLMIDLDQFKAVNDEYGHLVGDAVLAEVGAVLAGSVRPGDSAFRYGGEEFAVILPGASPGMTEEMAARICRDVAAYPFRCRQVTVSIGWSHYPRFATGCEQLVRQADRAVYGAKEAGGNRVWGSPQADFVA